MNTRMFFVVVVASFVIFFGCEKSNDSSNNPSLLAPMLYSPENGSTDQHTHITLIWTSVPNAAMYEVQVSTNSTFSSIAADDSLILGDSATISTTITSLSTNTTYYWRARAMNSASVSVWSSVWHFSTGNAASDSTYLQGIWLGTDQLGDENTWAYIFTGNTLVIKVDGVTQDSGFFSIDTLVTPYSMSIQIIKAANASYNGATIKTIYKVNTSGSFILMYVLMNAPGVPSPDSASYIAAGSTNDSLLILRSQSNIGG